MDDRFLICVRRLITRTRRAVPDAETAAIFEFFERMVGDRDLPPDRFSRNYAQYAHDQPAVNLFAHALDNNREAAPPGRAIQRA